MDYRDKYPWTRKRGMGESEPERTLPLALTVTLWYVIIL